MRNERTFVGLDVHAWSVTGHALDAVTGEVWQRKLSPNPADIWGWLKTLPQPAASVFLGIWFLKLEPSFQAVIRAWSM